MVGGREKQKKARHYVEWRHEDHLDREIATASDHFYSSQLVIGKVPTLLLLRTLLDYFTFMLIRNNQYICWSFYSILPNMADRSYLMQARSFLTLTYYVLEYPSCQTWMVVDPPYYCYSACCL